MTGELEMTVINGNLTGVVSSAHLVTRKSAASTLLKKTTLTTDTQDAVANGSWSKITQTIQGLQNQHGQIYHSVTHILKHTAPQSQKDALERWSKRAGSGLERDIACDRHHCS